MKLHLAMAGGAITRACSLMPRCPGHVPTLRSFCAASFNGLDQFAPHGAEACSIHHEKLASPLDSRLDTGEQSGSFKQKEDLSVGFNGVSNASESIPTPSAWTRILGSYFRQEALAAQLDGRLDVREHKDFFDGSKNSRLGFERVFNISESNPTSLAASWTRIVGSCFHHEGLAASPGSRLDLRGHRDFFDSTEDLSLGSRKVIRGYSPELSCLGTPSSIRRSLGFFSHRFHSADQPSGLDQNTPPKDLSTQRYPRRSQGTKPAANVLEKSPGTAFPGGHLLTDHLLPPNEAAVADPLEPHEEEDVLEASPVPEVWGRVHSIESFSAVDGPGIRSVVFLQGCLRRCNFCSNPDTWSPTAECQRLSSKHIAARLTRNLPYYAEGGGVTLSGGEPMMQPHFVAAVFKEAHALGISTCIDTAGYGHQTDYAEVLPHTDIVMLCSKAMDPKLYFDMVRVPQKVLLDFAKAVADYGVPLVIRFVLVPGFTDNIEEVDALVAWAKQQPTLLGIEMLPYHRLGVNKWEALGLNYPLEGLEPLPKEEVNKWKSYITSRGIKVML